MEKSRKVAKRGGGVAGNARKQTEKELKESVISKMNFLPKEETPDSLDPHAEEKT